MKAKFLESLTLTKHLIQNRLALLTALFAISCTLNLATEDALQLMTPAQEGQRWTIQLVMGLWGLAEGIFILFILGWALAEVHKFRANGLLKSPFATPYVGSFFAEFLRALAQTLMWGILLVLPGVWRYCQLIFVPAVAFFSKDYREGKVDALELSTRLTRGHMMTVIGIFLGTTALQAICEFTPQMVPELHTLFFRIGFSLLAFLISIWTYSVIFLLFENYLLSEES